MYTVSVHLFFVFTLHVYEAFLFIYICLYIYSPLLHHGLSRDIFLLALVHSLDCHDKDFICSRSILSKNYIWYMDTLVIRV